KSIAPDLDLSKIELAQISLTKLDLSGDLFAGSFRGEIGVDTKKAATFKLGEKEYGITGMSLAMQLDKLGGAEALTTGNAGTDKRWMVGYSLEGQFSLRNTPIVISAQYDDDGWALLGGTEGDQGLEVGNLIADLFPALSIPPTLTNLKLANISF